MLDWILNRLACGSFEDAQAPEPRITVIMNLSERAYSSTARLIHAPFPDEVYLEPLLWSERVAQLRALLHSRETVLVHCRLGKSRSPSLCAAYLMACGMATERALQYVTTRRHLAQPHAETWRGVLAWYKEHSHAQAS